MSTLGDIVEGIREVLTIRTELTRLSEAMVEVQSQLRAQDNRLVRLETYLEIGQRLLLR